MYFFGDKILFLKSSLYTDSYYPKAGESPQIYTTGIFMVKSLYLQASNFLPLGTVFFS